MNEVSFSNLLVFLSLSLLLLLSLSLSSLPSLLLLTWSLCMNGNNDIAAPFLHRAWTSQAIYDGEPSSQSPSSSSSSSYSSSWSLLLLLSLLRWTFVGIDKCYSCTFASKSWNLPSSIWMRYHYQICWCCCRCRCRCRCCSRCRCHCCHCSWNCGCIWIEKIM